MFNQEEQPETTTDHAVSLTALPRPQTPTFRRIKLDWHGMLSPQTPSCNVGGDNKLPGSDISAVLDYGGERDGEVFWRDELTYSNTRPHTSPVTPRCESSSVSSGTSGSRDQHQITPATSAEGDVDFALQLSSPSSIRRSARLHGRMQTEGTSSVLSFCWKVAD
jgi:hypothetical protein